MQIQISRLLPSEANWSGSTLFWKGKNTPVQQDHGEYGSVISWLGSRTDLLRGQGKKILRTHIRKVNSRLAINWQLLSIYQKYSDILTSEQIFPTIWTNPFLLPVVCCWMSGLTHISLGTPKRFNWQKHRPRSDPVLCRSDQGLHCLQIVKPFFSRNI